MANYTEVNEFNLLALTNLWGLQGFLFVLFLILYMISLLGNGAVVAVVVNKPQLQTPMYFFLGNLSCLDIFYSTVTVPKMLAGLLSGNHTISFAGCLAQLHFVHFLGSSEAMLLAVMACDRYVAICNPLRYTVVMNQCFCLLLVAITWATGFLHALMHLVMNSQLQFCGPNNVHHFFCDIKPLLQLACSSTSLNLILLNTMTGSIALALCLLMLLSYLYIISFLPMKVKLQENRKKAFSTCASHVMVVTLYYGTAVIIYLCPSLDSMAEEMIVTLMYSVVTPALNPLIYTLRNNVVKSAMRKAEFCSLKEHEKWCLLVLLRSLFLIYIN